MRGKSCYLFISMFFKSIIDAEQLVRVLLSSCPFYTFTGGFELHLESLFELTTM